MDPVELNWQPLPSDYELSTLAMGGSKAVLMKLLGLVFLLWALFAVCLVLARLATLANVLGSLLVAVALCFAALKFGPPLIAKAFLKRNPEMLAPAIGRIDDDGISIWQADRVMKASWSEIRNWHETPDVIYCQIDIEKDRSYIGLPKRAAASPTQLESLRETLRAHAPQR